MKFSLSLFLLATLWSTYSFGTRPRIQAYSCKNWVEMDNRKKEFMPISSSTCNKIKCEGKEFKVIGGGGNSGFEVTVDKYTEHLEFVPQFDPSDMNYIYNGKKLLFSMDSDGTHPTLTLNGTFPVIGVICKELQTR